MIVRTLTVIIIIIFRIALQIWPIKDKFWGLPGGPPCGFCQLSAVLGVWWGAIEVQS